MRRLGTARREDPLRHADQLVGPVPHHLEPLDDLLDPVLQPLGGIPPLVVVRLVMNVVVRARRARGPWRPRRPVVPASRAVVFIVINVAGQFPGRVGGFLRLLGRLGRLAGQFDGLLGPPPGLLSGGAGLIGPLLGPGDLLVGAPFPRQVGRFLGQVRGALRRARGLIRALGPDLGFLRRLPRALRELASPPGLLFSGGLLFRGPLRFRGVLLFRCGLLFRGKLFVGLVLHVVVLVLHGVPGDAVRLAGLRHPLPRGALPGFVRSHDRSSSRRVCPRLLATVQSHDSVKAPESWTLVLVAACGAGRWKARKRAGMRCQLAAEYITI